ncbi:MAG: polysaccharide deacetylase family protein [Actinomycetota bacterium]
MTVCLSAILIAAAFLATAALAVSYYAYHGIGPQDGVLRNGNPQSGKKTVLTFDDGPSAEYTPIILDILRDRGVKAVFFLTGRQAEKHPEIVRRILDDGHEIGNHTYSHVNLVFLREKDWQDEILRGEQAIAEITGRKPGLFRPPRCLFNERMRRFILDRGDQIILWSVSAADWLPLGQNFVSWRVRRFIKPGSIILFHDGGALVKSHGGRRDSTVKSLQIVIDSLRANGYEFTSLSKLTAARFSP